MISKKRIEVDPAVSWEVSEEKVLKWLNSSEAKDVFSEETSWNSHYLIDGEALTKAMLQKDQKYK